MRNLLRKPWEFITSQIDTRDEALVTVGLTLITVALWPTFERGALLVPGVVLLWAGLPARGSFVVRDIPKKES